MKMKCHGPKVQGRQEDIELFYLFVGQRTEDGGKCHHNHDLSLAAGVSVRKYQFISFNPKHFCLISSSDNIFISTGSILNLTKK